MAEFDHLVEELEGVGRNYVKKMNDELDRLSAERDQSRMSYRLVLFVFISIYAICAYYSYLWDKEELMLIPAPFLFFATLKLKKSEVVHGDIKTKVMTELCRHAGFNFRLQPDENELTVYRMLDLVSFYDRSEIEDQIMGQIDGVNFNLFEANLTASRLVLNSLPDETVFKGILASFDYPKRFSGITVLANRERPLHRVDNELIGKEHRVLLDDPDFNQIYNAYTTDHNQARELLSSGFIKRAIEVSGKLGRKPVLLAFYQGKIYLAVERQRNYFEGGGFLYHDPAYVKQYVTDLAIIFLMIDEFNLSKQKKA